MLSAVLSYSVVSNSATVWTVACQAPLSMRFSRQEYPSGLPCPPPGDLPNLGTEPRSPTLQADSLPSEPPGKTIITQVVAYLSSRGSSQPRNRTRLQGASLPAELPRMPDCMYVSNQVEFHKTKHSNSQKIISEIF